MLVVNDRDHIIHFVRNAQKVSDSLHIRNTASYIGEINNLFSYSFSFFSLFLGCLVNDRRLSTILNLQGMPQFK